MSDPESREEETLGLWIREAGDPSVSPEPWYSERLREMVLARACREARPARFTSRRVALCLAGLAALVLVGVVVCVTGSGLSWAQVVVAVRAKAWIHATAKVPEAGTYESWFSPVREVSAMRSPEYVEFDDYRQNARYTYDPQTKTVFRVPASQSLKESSLSFQRLFESIFRDDAKVENPLPGQQLVGQQRRQLQEAGRSWTEYQLDLRADSVENRLTFRVDPQTRLPASMTVVSTPRGDYPKEKPLEVTFTLDYPEQGPADIYALGVPRAARVDDRVPSGELARLLDGIKSSRDRFPQTYLVLITHTFGSAPTQIPTFVWRKGEKWRREYRIPEARSPAERKALQELKPPPPGPEAAAWWKETTKGWRVQPMEICDGTAVYADMSKTDKIEWKKTRSGTDSGPIRQYLPEIQGYPSPPGPSQSFSIELDANPKEGPLGTVLLVARSTAGKGAPFHGRAFLSWIDPAKSCLVMRHEWTNSAPEPGKPESSNERYVVVGAAHAPNGVWYPTVVRREYMSGVPGQEKLTAETWTFSVDFKAEIPDELFRVETTQRHEDR